MRFLELKYKENIITNDSVIDNILEEEGMYWLLESEIENAKIEIKNNTVIWYDGYYFGDWHYGIFKNGEFHGTFHNGILEGGNFHGKFVSGLKEI